MIYFDIDLKSRTAIYEQIYKKTVELIINGQLKEDDQMPSVRALSAEISVNPNTIAKAYAMLEKDGIIYSLAGRGSFVAPTDELADAMTAQHIQQLEQQLIAAYRAGVSKQAVIELLEKLYKEAVDR